MAGALTRADANLQYLNLEALARSARVDEPFPHVIVPGFLQPAGQASVAADYPEIREAGSFPVGDLKFGRYFRDFLAELQGPEFRGAIERAFDIDLSERPTMVTVRGHARPRDGRIHNDSRTKLITVLVYMNEAWEADGGRLRLLRSPDNLDDVVAEVPPQAGTLLAFRVTGNSWHGHLPVAGPRRVVQLNWVESAAVVRRERTRHGLSARFKRLTSLLRSA
ncbi:MAG TPA: 2OG-Fe(II) oxygenase [Stellaceae bacterium]|nr:2OG-Fe(II) oxygenase [Stellaceae bacterium]